ncbi:hypothetical protein AOB60_02295 [Streptomyces noursei]|uniref:Uncharacterized protein n=1 Tax=Streptomyces noursei TaxID=1971 RepID=A0A2N8PG16_STRNR|nr:hypothetical protein AOB60_02295 [Streptomyces noursei]
MNQFRLRAAVIIVEEIRPVSVSGTARTRWCWNTTFTAGVRKSAPAYARPVSGAGPGTAMAAAPATSSQDDVVSSRAPVSPAVSGSQASAPSTVPADPRACAVPISPEDAPRPWQRTTRISPSPANAPLTSANHTSMYRRYELARTYRSPAGPRLRAGLARACPQRSGPSGVRRARAEPVTPRKKTAAAQNGARGR